MYDVITKLGDTLGYIKIEEHNLIITPDIQSASKFRCSSEAITHVLKKARVSFKNEKFVVSSCSDSIFGERPRNIVEEEVILNDSYFYTVND